MIKRIKYISRFAKPMGRDEIDALVEAATRKNADLGITGVLMASGGVFFQVLEGPAEAVDRLYATIAADTRHQQVLLLGVEENVTRHIFPDWSIRKLDLDASADTRLEPLRALLTAVWEQRRLLDELTNALQRGAWHELVKE